MQFAKSLRPRIKSGEITTSIRIWIRQRVREGKRYRLDEGWIEINTVKEIALGDVTPSMAKESGFQGLVDLLKVAKHGKGERVFLVSFTYIGSGKSTS